jgi:hypothetical protein
MDALPNFSKLPEASSKVNHSSHLLYILMVEALGQRLEYERRVGNIPGLRIVKG